MNDAEGPTGPFELRGTWVCYRVEPSVLGAAGALLAGAAKTA
ncbi:hypothetical protein ACFCYI_12775 [Streptomyces sp. NPDC056257]